MLSFLIVIYITNGSNDTKERLVTGPVSWCGSKRSFTEVEYASWRSPESRKGHGYSPERYSAGEEKKRILDNRNRRIKLGSENQEKKCSRGKEVVQ